MLDLQLQHQIAFCNGALASSRTRLPKGWSLQLDADGAYELKISGVVEQPFWIQNRSEVAVGSSMNVIQNLRILLEENAIAQIIVSCDSTSEGALDTQSNLNIHLLKNSQLSYAVLHRENSISNFSQTGSVLLRESASLEQYIFSLGAKSSNFKFDIDLQAEQASAQVGGLYLLRNKEKAQHEVIVRHSQKNSKSNQLFKGILDDESHSQFTGCIRVEKGAVGTEAYQLNRNMLLSRKAEAYSRPQLEIWADDVKCKHGSTLGQLSDDELFYLQSRCINATKARELLIRSFAEEVIQRLSSKQIRDIVDKEFHNWYYQRGQS